MIMVIINIIIIIIIIYISNTYLFINAPDGIAQKLKLCTYQINHVMWNLFVWLQFGLRLSKYKLSHG